MHKMRWDQWLGFFVNERGFSTVAIISVQGTEHMNTICYVIVPNIHVHIHSHTYKYKAKSCTVCACCTCCRCLYNTRVEIITFEPSFHQLKAVIKNLHVQVWVYTCITHDSNIRLFHTEITFILFFKTCINHMYIHALSLTLCLSKHAVITTCICVHVCICIYFH